ncbi:hypothetical protein C4K04_5269 [Pseudomonas chlororaphis]|uniref:Uncharacterized protein n=1 Tax=Pseudomonas chlororaphis TaxID=587753 RepID=A0A3G7TX67_9PSED|nr:hypothetical protein C4K04_5269 [Pseudomonas chlororaphis]
MSFLSRLQWLMLLHLLLALLALALSGFSWSVSWSSST